MHVAGKCQIWRGSDDATDATSGHHRGDRRTGREELAAMLAQETVRMEARRRDLARVNELLRLVVAPPGGIAGSAGGAPAGPRRADRRRAHRSPPG